jgi:hypothetical protein
MGALDQRSHYLALGTGPNPRASDGGHQSTSGIRQELTGGRLGRACCADELSGARFGRRP